jgi:hypothetical protein
MSRFISYLRGENVEENSFHCPHTVAHTEAALVIPKSFRNTVIFLIKDNDKNYGAHFPLKMPSYWMECSGSILGPDVQIGSEIH